MNLKLGVLIIGSLYWDEAKPHRDKWRKDRLQMSEVVEVKAPIRYGRESTSRGKTYTMVFSPDCQTGQAKAVPCARSISKATDLIEEAEWLWIAEQPSENDQKLKRELSANWGCVALLAHPKFQASKELLHPLLDEWAKRISCETAYNGKGYAPSDALLVNGRGLLQIPWPSIGKGTEHLPYDLLIATVTKPTLDAKLGEYPSVETVVGAWERDLKGNDRYFWWNRKHGICTFQDEEIRKRLAMTQYAIVVHWSKKDASWIASVPDLESCSASGAMPEQAVTNVRTELQKWLTKARKAGDAIPEPRYRPRMRQSSQR